MGCHFLIHNVGYLDLFGLVQGSDFGFLYDHTLGLGLTRFNLLDLISDHYFLYIFTYLLISSLFFVHQLFANLLVIY